MFKDNTYLEKLKIGLLKKKLTRKYHIDIFIVYVESVSVSDIAWSVGSDTILL